MTIQKRVKEMGVILLAIGIALSAIISVQAKRVPRSKGVKKMQVGNYQFSGPYTHENLSIFLIQGEEKIKDKTFLTLQEAIEQKKIIVHETSNVNELAIENVSQDEEVYIQSGDIVKGGKQDRVLAFDLIVPPRSGKMPIASFCVEHGRWRQRGKEEAGSFDSSSEQLATKDLKLAAKQKSNQQEVWDKVAETQEKLTKNLGHTDVISVTSASSLQLTLENKKVKETADAYIKALSKITEGKKNLIGYAFAINGKVNSADLYASGELFRKLWPKLLKASAVEAIAELEKGKKFAPATAEDVKACFLDAEKGKASEKNVTKRIRMVTKETEKNLLFETCDLEQKEAWVHRNYIKK